jgi:phage protein D
MAINDPSRAEGVRQPRAKALLNGTPLPGLIEAEVTSNSHYNSDKFTAHFSLYRDPAYGPGWWGKQTELLLDIQFSQDGQNFTSMIIGDVDHLSLDPLNGIVTVDGRDLSSRLIDNKTVEAFRNKTSSEIAELLAQRHSLTSDVQATTEKVGRYYDIDHDRIQHNEFSSAHTEWDLLTMLAQFEGFDCWVTGTTLHFKPVEDAAAQDPYEIVWKPGDEHTAPKSNVVSIHLERSLTLAKDVVVAVRSYNSRKKTGFTMYAPSGFRQASIQSGKAQMFTFLLPNLDRDKAQDKANKLREEISRHEKLLHFTRPADLVLDARHVVKLTGLDPDTWDQVYYINSVTRHLSDSAGFTMEVSCKNKSTNSQSIVT